MTTVNPRPGTGPIATGPIRPKTRTQVRIFVFVWTILTVLVGACVFIAIYFASGDPRLASLLAVYPTPTPIPATATLIPTAPAVEPPTATPPPASAPDQGQPAQPPTPTATLPPREDRSFGYGIQVQENYELEDYWMAMVANTLRLNWIKQQVRWKDLEPEKGKIDFSLLDLVVPTANKHGLKVMLSVVTAPDWARPPGANLDANGPPAVYDDYANFLTAILKRYPGQVHAIEVWNEQNLDREWNDPGGLSAERYVQLLGIAQRAIRAVDPGVIVISGALSPTGVTSASAVDDFRFFDQLVAAGMLNYTDCVGAHHNGINVPPDAVWDNPASLGPRPQYYTGPWDNPHHSWSFRSTLEYYYSKIVASGGTQRLCITEFGWPTTEGLSGPPRQGFEFALDNTLDEQAKWIVQAFTWLSQWDGAWLAFLWNLNYSPQAGGDPTNDNVPYSILAADGSPRPAFDALANMPKNP